MASRNSQSRRMALADMLKQRPINDERMARYMSPEQPSIGQNSANQGIGQLSDGYNRPTAPMMQDFNAPPQSTGLTSNFYDPSYGIDRGFADQMTATNKRMVGTDAGQTQYDPATKSFYQTGGMTRNGPNPTLNGTYDQMYHKYDINNQLAGLGTPAAGGMAQAGGNQFNAAQLDFMGKNQDVYGPYSSPSDQNGNKLQAMKDAQDAQAASQGGLSQPTQTNYAAPTSSLSGQQGVGLAALGSQAMPTQSTALGQLPKTPSYAAPTANTSFNNQSPVNMTQPQSNNYQAQGTAGMSQLQSSGQSVPGYPQQIGNQRSAAPRAKTASRGKLSQLMPPPGG